jgi:hypothetical protein
VGDKRRHDVNNKTLPVEANLKQAAVQDFCKALRYHDLSIISMYFDSEKETVQVRYTCGSVLVDVKGKNIPEILAAILKEVA